ncbi:SIMPL domain-containing protein [Rummeliibacillus pycnus]|uniref:SIMPL domain-containing protein n=1 Tax=Rummeliibacillus pycnus TaxID=101070 RepID=UPI000C9B2B8C|nr:SIMPL domain-containing protein [Rummeliibacillus pycnus]
MNHQIANSLLRVITVIGNGKITAIPNYVQLQIEVLTNGKEVSTASQENAAIMNRVIQSLLALGISREDIQTAAYTITPTYDYFDGKQVFRGYEVMNAITVKVRDINQVGTVIDTAVKNGANRVSGIQFKIDHVDDYYQQALSLALRDAQMKANTIAETMHLHVPPQPIEVIEENTVEPVLYKTAAMASQNFATPIEQGLITISAALRVKFQF